ncbi:MAG: hypothetical protein HYU75_07360 [Betaproteobacteria bacterium]|nr:hypothetical protein [Betaproteobacteria bacterium]
MTVVASTTLSILAIAALAWAVRRALRVELCPICLGVAGTWLWMLLARFAGLAVDASMLAVLLGGSAVGLAYQLERRLPPGRSPLLWKALFIPAGFVAAYALAGEHWVMLAGAGIALVALAAVFLLASPARAKDPAAVAKLEQQMKKCC